MSSCVFPIPGGPERMDKDGWTNESPKKWSSLLYQQINITINILSPVDIFEFVFSLEMSSDSVIPLSTKSDKMEHFSFSTSYHKSIQNR